MTALNRWKSSKSGGNYPMRWKVTIPSEEIEREIVPAFQDQELITNRSTRVTYWEGAVKIQGAIQNRSIAGQGYVEMTGYAGKLSI
jgi:predicted secreted hydrolase